MLHQDLTHKIVLQRAVAEIILLQFSQRNQNPKNRNQKSRSQRSRSLKSRSQKNRSQK